MLLAHASAVLFGGNARMGLDVSPAQAKVARDSTVNAILTEGRSYDRVLVAVTPEGEPWRRRVESSYQEHGDHAPELYDALDGAVGDLRAAGCHILAAPEYPVGHPYAGAVPSARDVIATVVTRWCSDQRRASVRRVAEVERAHLAYGDEDDGTDSAMLDTAEPRGRLAIMSGRPSLAVLIDDDAGVTLLAEMRGKWTPVTSRTLKAWKPWGGGPEVEGGPKIGVPRAQYVDFAALESVPRIGPKTARALLKAYGASALEAAARVQRGEPTPELDKTQRAALLAVGVDGMAQRMEVQRLRADVPLDVAAILGGERPQEARDDDGRREDRDRTEGHRLRAEPGTDGRRPVPRAVPDDGGAQPPLRGGGGDRGTDDRGGEGEAREDVSPVAAPLPEPLGARGGEVAAVAPPARTEQPATPPTTTRTEERAMSTEQHPQQQNPAPRNQKREAQQARADRITALFRARFRELEALFPKDGKALVTRAQASARMVSMKLDAEVTAESIAESVMAVHHLGLEVGEAGAYVYPYKNKGVKEAKVTIGPMGLIDLAFRGGFLRSIVARAVFEGDDFHYNLANVAELRHVKTVSGRREREGRDGQMVHPPPEELISHVYAVWETTTGGREHEVLTWEDIAYYRSFSKADSGPWFDNFEGMARKTVLKRALAFMPRSALLSAALAEREDSTYAIPDELMEAMRKGNGKAAPAAEPEPAAQDEPAANDDGSAAQGARR